MCGRFALGRLVADEVRSELERQYHVEVSERGGEPTEFFPRFNVCPQTRSLILRSRKNGEEHTYSPSLDIMKWGLFSKVNPNIINCRADSLLDGPDLSPLWRKVRASPRKRCVVITEGFYEWKRSGKTRIPYFTKLPDKKLMLMAGLWDETKTKDGEEVDAFAIITTTSNAQLKFLHDRMPVIFENTEDINLWLSTEPWSNRIASIVKPYSKKLICYQVSTDVNSIKAQSKTLVEPIDESKASIKSFFSLSPVKTSPTQSSKKLHSSPADGSGTGSQSSVRDTKEILLKQQKEDEDGIFDRKKEDMKNPLSSEEEPTAKSKETTSNKRRRKTNDGRKFKRQHIASDDESDDSIVIMD